MAKGSWRRIGRRQPVDRGFHAPKRRVPLREKPYGMVWQNASIRYAKAAAVGGQLPESRIFELRQPTWAWAWKCSRIHPSPFARSKEPPHDEVSKNCSLILTMWKCGAGTWPVSEGCDAKLRELLGWLCASQPWLEFADEGSRTAKPRSR